MKTAQDVAKLVGALLTTKLERFPERLRSVTMPVGGCVVQISASGIDCVERSFAITVAEVPPQPAIAPAAEATAPGN